jgi:hypothetical protein
MFSIFGGVMTKLAYTTLMERRVMAFADAAYLTASAPWACFNRWPTV